VQKREVPELDRRYALRFDIILRWFPGGEEFDLGTLGVGECKDLRQGGSRVVAALDADPMRLQFARHRVKVGGRRHLEGDLAATGLAALAQFNREVAELAREIAPVLLLGRKHEPNHVGVVIAKPLQVRRLEGGMSDPARFDHGCSRKPNGRARSLQLTRMSLRRDASQYLPRCSLCTTDSTTMCSRCGACRDGRRWHRREFKLEAVWPVRERRAAAAGPKPGKNFYRPFTIKVIDMP
jgi:hypothetical protein